MKSESLSHDNLSTPHRRQPPALVALQGLTPHQTVYSHRWHEHHISDTTGARVQPLQQSTSSNQIANTHCAPRRRCHSVTDATDYTALRRSSWVLLVPPNDPNDGKNPPPYGYQSDDAIFIYGICLLVEVTYLGLLFHYISDIFHYISCRSFTIIATNNRQPDCGNCDWPHVTAVLIGQFLCGVSEITHLGSTCGRRASVATAVVFAGHCAALRDGGTGNPALPSLGTCRHQSYH